MIRSTPKKTGRPIAVYRTADGTQVVGLWRLTDGRWRASGPERFTFTEPDERLAVARYREWQQRNQTPNAARQVVHLTAATLGADINQRIRAGATEVSIDVPYLPAETPPLWLVSDDVLRPEQWAWLHAQILNRPQWVAERVGIEQIGYLQDVPKPTPSLTLVEVGKAYFTRNDVSPKELQKCESAWKEFRRVTGADTLKDILPEMVAKYGQVVNKLGLAPKSICHRYNRVKTVLGNFMHSGRDIEGTRRAIDCCQVLRSPSAVSLDPHPISRSNYQKLLDAATTEEKALLLVAMNLCYYPIDISRLKWGHLDLERGVYFEKRGKTKVARAAVLWGRTMEALKLVIRCDDDAYVFHSALSGRPHTDNTVRKLFANLRKRVGLGKEVQFADLRDGSFTAAVAGEGVEFQHARVLAGHRSGIADAYVLRNPAMTTKACIAVEKHYFG